MSRTSILLADDHAIVLDCLVSLLRPHFNILGATPDGCRLVEMAKEKRPEVIVSDIEMRSISGIEAARLLRKCQCSAKFLFLTMHSEFPIIAEAFRAGAAGIVLKTCDTEELLMAIQAVAKGATYVTPILGSDFLSSLLSVHHEMASRDPAVTIRQRELLRLIVEGKTMKEAAAVMGISPRTAESHKYEMMRLLGFQTVPDLIRYAIRLRLV
jgi:DNA-binding NarL/FixJ family response regulator